MIVGRQPTLAGVGKRLPHRKILAEAIRFYRKQAKFTQERLGEAAELNPKYIGEVERCEKTISVDSLARIAAALKVDLADFFRKTPDLTNTSTHAPDCV